MAVGPRNEFTFALRPSRSANARPTFVRNVLFADLFVRLALVVYVTSMRFLATDVVLFTPLLLWAMATELLVASLFLVKFGRWEEHGHFVTLWQVLASVMVFQVRQSLYANPAIFVIVMLELSATYWVGLGTELHGDSNPRLPPFVPKKNDKHRPSYGWLGPKAASVCKTEVSRMLATLALYITSLTKIITFFYFGSISVYEEMIAIGENLNMLFYIAVFLAIYSLFPNILVDLCTLPEFWTDMKNFKQSKKAGRTEPFEVAIIDEDNLDNDFDSDIKCKLRNHTCCSITVVIPCYMPNEEEIIMDVLDYYREQQKRYPGELKVLVVYNSPDSHHEIEDRMFNLRKEWPSFKFRRDLLSTSKCDNLNTAIEYIDTDVALLNDADTMVSAEAFIRASLLITDGHPDQQVDIAQCHSTHCKEDVTGCIEGGWFCFAPIVTIGDASKPKNMATQGMFKHAPFNGRGGFWRVSALKLVGFDHRCIGEDHDAAYRGVAYYGLRGVMDPNMLCQEREPPDCASLTKQRIRWETAALEMRRTFPWVLRSPYYSKFEAFVLIWSQLSTNANLPLQYMPMQVFILMTQGITKAFLWRHVFGDNSATWKNMCWNEDCVAHFRLRDHDIALPLAFVIFASIFAVVLVLSIIDCFCRTATTRYRSRFAFCFTSVFVSSFTMVPFLTFCQFGALKDYCFGSAKFIATKRSSSSENSASKSSLATIISQNSMTNLEEDSNLVMAENADLKTPLLKSKSQRCEALV